MHVRKCAYFVTSCNVIQSSVRNYILKGSFIRNDDDDDDDGAEK